MKKIIAIVVCVAMSVSYTHLKGIIKMTEKSVKERVESHER